jgi:DNA-binding beta-propeller fold protein YncE
LLYTMAEGTNTLEQIDTSTMARTVVGSTGVASGDFGGMAYDPASDTLYWVPGRGNNNLYTINRTTGAASLIGAHGINDLFGLEFDTSTGTLYGSQFSGGSNLFTLNTGTGAATLIGNMGLGMGGLAYDSKRDQLVGDNDGGGRLYSINRSTAAISLLASPGYNDDSGLAYDYDADVFYDYDYSGSLFRIDPNAGYARTTLFTGTGSHDGLAYVGSPLAAAVPEPSGLALVALGLIGLAATRRRAKAG